MQPLVELAPHVACDGIDTGWKPLLEDRRCAGERGTIGPVGRLGRRTEVGVLHRTADCGREGGAAAAAAEAAATGGRAWPGQAAPASGAARAARAADTARSPADPPERFVLPPPEEDGVLHGPEELDGVLHGPQLDEGLE